VNLIGLLSPAPLWLIGVPTGAFAFLVVLSRLANSSDHKVRIKSSRIALLVSKRVARLVGFVSACLLGLLLLGVSAGDYPVPIASVIKTLLWDQHNEFSFVINSIRVPRVLVAILAGICLAVSGYIFQCLIRNPLVSPDIIGINSGASVGAVIVLASGGTVSSLSSAAFAGALLTAAAIYSLSRKSGVSGSRLVLVGIGVNAVLAAVISFIQVTYPIDRIIAAARWQVGSLDGTSWTDVQQLIIGILILLPPAFLFTRNLRTLQLGDEIATSLGVHIERDRFVILLIASALAALAVSVVGPLGFIALAVPQFARLWIGRITSGALIFTAILGGNFLLLADTVALRLFAPVALPTGVVSAAIGAPYFLVLLTRYHRLRT
tara:strand:- start:333 stop:1466 length:1134 start_codon:yes stop_codon:yes gene_type:complete